MNYYCIITVKMSKTKIYYGMNTQTRFFKTLEIKVGIVGHAWILSSWE